MIADMPTIIRSYGKLILVSTYSEITEAQYRLFEFYRKAGSQMLSMNCAGRRDFDFFASGYFKEKLPQNGVVNLLYGRHNVPIPPERAVGDDAIKVGSTYVASCAEKCDICISTVNA